MFGIITSGKWNYIRTYTMWCGLNDHLTRLYTYPKSEDDTLVGPLELARWLE